MGRFFPISRFALSLKSCWLLFKNVLLNVDWKHLQRGAGRPDGRTESCCCCTWKNKKRKVSLVSLAIGSLEAFAACCLVYVCFIGVVVVFLSFSLNFSTGFIFCLRRAGGQGAWSVVEFFGGKWRPTESLDREKKKKNGGSTEFFSDFFFLVFGAISVKKKINKRSCV